MLTAPAKRIATGPRYQSALWSSVSWRRKRWLRDLEVGQRVEVLDDGGAIYETTVRGLRVHPCSGRHPHPQVWLEGHGPSYAAARIYPLGKAPRMTLETL